jgi:hypothetical protein
MRVWGAHKATTTRGARRLSKTSNRFEPALWESYRRE